MGVLWDEILPKRSVANPAYLQALEKHRETVELSETPSTAESHLEKGVGIELENEIDGRGALMFLVRRLTSDDEVKRLELAGYRFVDLGQVCNDARNHLQMQISSTEFELKLRDMKSFINQQHRIKPGVHLGLFAVQDGFNEPQVLVQKTARDLLPLTPLPMEALDESHIGIVHGLVGFPVPEVIQRLRTSGASSRTPDEEMFAYHLSNAIHSLRELVHEPLYHDAVLSSTILRLPFGIDGDDADETVIMALRLKISHPVISSGPSCQWVPLNFFAMRQVLEQSRQEFVRVLHQDFDPLKLPASRVNNGLTSGPLSTLRRLKGSDPSASSKGKKSIIGLQSSSKDSTRSSSTINLCPPGNSEAHNERLPSTDTVDIYPPERHFTSHQQSFLNGGIVVFQEVTVQVEKKKYEPVNELAIQWSHDSVTEPPRVHQRQQHKEDGVPITTEIELQPAGRGTNEVSVESRWLHSFGRADNNITTIASFVDALITESGHSTT
ncbi:hypothetical protein IL306_005036 [Fusarium sp. DS 682]|nr:hypothetical protein IL306_005036 [Fusarium sp. DS 682]